MNREAFLAALGETPRTWSTGDHGAIRNGFQDCPLEAVERVEGVTRCNDRESAVIMNAADDVERCSRPLRQKMLVACGLSEV